MCGFISLSPPHKRKRWSLIAGVCCVETRRLHQGFRGLIFLSSPPKRKRWSLIAGVCYVKMRRLYQRIQVVITESYVPWEQVAGCSGCKWAYSTPIQEIAVLLLQNATLRTELLLLSTFPHPIKEQCSWNWQCRSVECACNPWEVKPVDALY